jgi:hypothetical protein
MMREDAAEDAVSTEAEAVDASQVSVEKPPRDGGGPAVPTESRHLLQQELAWTQEHEDLDGKDLFFQDPVLLVFPTEDPRSLRGRFYEKQTLEMMDDDAASRLTNDGKTPAYIKRKVRQPSGEVEVVIEMDGTKWCGNPMAFVEDETEQWIPRSKVKDALNHTVGEVDRVQILQAEASFESRSALRDAVLRQRATQKYVLLRPFSVVQPPYHYTNLSFNLVTQRGIGTTRQHEPAP